jgi:hypothetical protein
VPEYCVFKSEAEDNATALDYCINFNAEGNNATALDFLVKQELVV